ncbi:50S ribosome-binding GTPase [Candidatus Woesearchaeota archaeon]|nr:50S ribosome-binding GTPase [Candidatus Woesearchaeota archaeon]
MNFQYMQKIESADTYLDRAIHAAKKRVSMARERVPRMREKDARRKQVQYFEIELITEVQDNLAGMLSKIYLKFPNLEELDPFYNALARITIRYNLTKQALGSVNWAEKQCRETSWKVVIGIKKTWTLEEIQKLKNAYFGRIGSVMRQIQKHLEIIEESRKIMKTWPDIKPDVRTIAISGYPNVGKSSILKALTQTQPNIQAYAFTTKSLNIGYFDVEPRTYQVIDTPGAFDRELDKMNNIEKQAMIVLKQLAQRVVYVFDPSESCGYEVEAQIELLKRIQKMTDKEIIIVANKMDLESGNIEKIKKLFPTVREICAKEGKGIEALKKSIAFK